MLLTVILIENERGKNVGNISLIN